MRSWVLVVGSAALTAGCAIGPFGRREWPAATPEAQRLDAPRLRALVSRMEQGAYGEITSLLVVRHGRLVVERYFRGAGPDDPQPLQSVTKSIASLLVGIAVDQGRFPGLDAPVASFFPEYADIFAGDAVWRALPVPEGELYAWDPASTYVRRPPYFDGMPAVPGPIEDIAGARVLCLLGDSITTDHISPAGAIRPCT